MRSLPQKAGHLDSHLVSLRVTRSSLTAFLCLISCHIHLCVKPCVRWHPEASALFFPLTAGAWQPVVFRTAPCRARQIPVLNSAAWGKYGPFYDGGFKWRFLRHRLWSCQQWRRGSAEVRPRPMVGITRHRGREKQGTNSPPTVLSMVLIPGWFFFFFFLLCSPRPSSAGQNSFTSPPETC